MQISKNVKSKLYHIGRANTVDLDEVAHHEPPHQDLLCLQIQLILSLVFKELKLILKHCSYESKILFLTTRPKLRKEAKSDELFPRKEYPFTLIQIKHSLDGNCDSMFIYILHKACCSPPLNPQY